MGINGTIRESVTLSGKELERAGLNVAIVGGTGGIGRAFARELAKGGARVTVVGRTFRDEDVPNIDFVAADLQLVSEARRVASELPAEALDLVVFTTGIFSKPQREVTAEDIELDLAVSYMSRFVILNEIAGRLGRTRARRARVFVMGFPGTGEAGNPEDLNSENGYKPMDAHMNTVAGNEALVLDAARRYENISVFGLNPGLIQTDIRANYLGGTDSLRFKVVEWLIGLMTPTPEQYAARMVPVLLDEELETESGFHFNKKGQPIEPSDEMTQERARAFIEASEALVARSKTVTPIASVGPRRAAG